MPNLGVGLLAVLLLQIDAAVIALLIGVCIAHELTTWWDLSYASSQRRIPLPEQWVHGVQQMLPWVGLAGVMLLHRPQALALWGIGDEPARWAWRLKEPQLPLGYLSALAAAASLLVGLPFLEEALRCARVCRTQRRIAENTPAGNDRSTLSSQQPSAERQSARKPR